MAKSKPTKRRVSAGRTTPKGTKPGERPEASTRYTPPVPQEVKVSPRWVPVLMFAFLAIGSLMIFLNYLELLPGAANNWYLLGGLGLILASIVTATQYH